MKIGFVKQRGKQKRKDLKPECDGAQQEFMIQCKAYCETLAENERK